MVTHLKVIGHGMFDANCQPQTFVLPDRIAVMFYVPHGRPLEGYIGRGIEATDMHDEMVSTARLLGRPPGLPTFADVSAVMRNVGNELSGGNPVELIPPGAICNNYRVSHVGTKNQMPGARQDILCGSIDPRRIPEPFLMPSPDQKLQLAQIIRDFAQPFLNVPGANPQLVLVHCLFCRDT